MKNDMRRLLDAIYELQEGAINDCILKIENMEAVVGDKLEMKFDLTVPEQNTMLWWFFNKLSWAGFYDLHVRTTHSSVLGSTRQEYGYFRVGHKDIILGSGDTVVNNHGFINELYISISANDWVDIHFNVDQHTFLTMCIPCQ